jgi:hypothetical protein
MTKLAGIVTLAGLILLVTNLMGVTVVPTLVIVLMVLAAPIMFVVAAILAVILMAVVGKDVLVKSFMKVRGEK